MDVEFNPLNHKKIKDGKNASQQPCFNSIRRRPPFLGSLHFRSKHHESAFDAARKGDVLILQTANHSKQGWCVTSSKPTTCINMCFCSLLRTSDSKRLKGEGSDTDLEKTKKEAAECAGQILHHQNNLRFLKRFKLIAYAKGPIRFFGEALVRGVRSPLKGPRIAYWRGHDPLMRNFASSWKQSRAALSTSALATFE